MHTPTHILSTLALLGLAGGLLTARAHSPGLEIGSFDANGDGTISKEEFETVAAARVNHLQTNFLAKYDSIPAGQTAGDGTITQAEATAVFEERAADWLEHVLEQFDTNNDGAISAADSTGRGRGRHGRPHLDSFDTNDDDVVSNEELIAAAADQAADHLARFLERFDSIPAGQTAGDGIITPAESLAVHTAVVQEHLDAILKRLDDNQDGSLGADELPSAPKGRGGPRGGKPGRR